MVSFNVLTEPWIPARAPDGTIAEWGILDTLAEAHRLVDLVDPSPPIQFGLYRLLIAFLTDALEVRELEDIEQLLTSGRLDRQRLEKYARRCGNCFDLFDPARPFLQVVADPAANEGATPAVALLQHLPSGTNVTHFHHGSDRDQALCPAVCARALTAIAPFMTAGGQGKSPSINGAPPWYVLVRGDNLFHTLLLNTCGLPLTWSRREDSPAWRSTAAVTAKQQVTRFSLLEGLTWRPRTVRLYPSEGGQCTISGRPSPVLVRTIDLQAGLRAVIEGAKWVDPQVPYRTTKDGRLALRPQEDHEMWRDLGPVTLLKDKDYAKTEAKVRFERPLVVSQYVQLQETGAIPPNRPLRVECYGMRTDNMKIFEWHVERLAVPPDVLRHPRAGKQVQDAMDQADFVAYVLKQAIRKAYPREGKGNDKAFGSVITAAQQGFWARLQPQFERDYLRQVAAQDDHDPDAAGKLLAGWVRVLMHEAASALDAALDQLDSDAQALRRAVEARDFLWQKLGYLTAAKGPNGSKPRNTKKKKEAV